MAITKQDMQPVHINPGRRIMLLGAPPHNCTMGFPIRAHRTTMPQACQVVLVLLRIKEGPLQVLQAPRTINNPTIRQNLDVKTLLGLPLPLVDLNKATTKWDILQMRINPGRRLMFLEAPHRNKYFME